MLCYVMLCYVMLCYVMLCYVLAFSALTSVFLRTEVKAVLTPIYTFAFICLFVRFSFY